MEAKTTEKEKTERERKHVHAVPQEPRYRFCKNDGADYSVTGSTSGRQNMDHVLLLGGS